MPDQTSALLTTGARGLFSLILIVAYGAIATPIRHGGRHVSFLLTIFNDLALALRPLCEMR